MHAITAFPHLTFPMHSDAFCIISTEYSGCHAFKPLFASGIAQSRGTLVMVMHRCLTYAALATNTYNNGFIIKGNTPRIDHTPVARGTEREVMHSSLCLHENRIPNVDRYIRDTKGIERSNCNCNYANAIRFVS